MLANEIRTLISQINAQMLTRSLSTNNLRLAGASLLDIADRVERIEKLAIPPAQMLPETASADSNVTRLDDRRQRPAVAQPGGRAS